jgi:hypothetical protein
MMMAVKTHWNHVTNNGAGIVAPLLDKRTLLLNTRQIDTVKYANTTCKSKAVATTTQRMDAEGAQKQPKITKEQNR